MNIIIRNAEIKDIQSIFEIQEKHNLSYWSLEDYKTEIDNFESLFFVAQINGLIVGFILTRMIESLNVAEIVNFSVDDNYQQKGIGKLLITELITNLIVKDYKKIELEVREQNLKAINFYSKNKFIVDGIRNNFYQNPPDNAVLMSLSIELR